MIRNPIFVPRNLISTIKQPYGYIYITTNLVTGKLYLGQHSSKTLDNSYLGSGVVLKKAIQKYGANNFKCESIDWAKTKEELNQKEIWWIDVLGCVKSSQWYNVATGGQGFSSGEKHPLYGKKMPEYQRLRIIETSPHIAGKNHPMYEDHRFIGENNPMYGKSGYLSPTFGRKHTFEERLKMKNNHADSSGGNNSQAKAVVQLNKKYQFVKEYSYLKEVISENFSEEGVRNCCKNRQNYHKGYIWMYKSDYEKWKKEGD